MDNFVVITMIGDTPLQDQKYWGVPFAVLEVAKMAAIDQHKLMIIDNPAAYTVIMIGNDVAANDDVVWLMVDEFVFENVEAFMISNILGDTTGRHALSIILKQRDHIIQLRKDIIEQGKELMELAKVMVKIKILQEQRE